MRRNASADSDLLFYEARPLWPLYGMMATLYAGAETVVKISTPELHYPDASFARSTRGDHLAGDDRNGSGTRPGQDRVR